MHKKSFLMWVSAKWPYPPCLARTMCIQRFRQDSLKEVARRLL